VSRVTIRRTTYGDYGAHPTTLLRLRGVAKSTPRAVGVWLGVLIVNGDQEPPDSGGLYRIPSG
jgi:hypothetical protein